MVCFTFGEKNVLWDIKKEINFIITVYTHTHTHIYIYIYIYTYIHITITSLKRLSIHISANENGLKWIEWIQIFRNIDSRMLKRSFSILNAFLFIYRNCMEHISMLFNLKIILAFSVHTHCVLCTHIVNTIQFKNLNRKCSFSIQLHPIESNWIQLNPIKSKKKYSLFKIRIRIEKNFNPF